MNSIPMRGLIVCLALAAVLSAVASPAAATPATGDDLQNPVHRYNATLASALFRSVFNGGDIDATVTLISPNAVIHTPYGEFVGPQGLQAYLDIVRRGYPDAWFEVTSIDIDGDTVVVHWTMTASRYQVGPTEGTVDVQVSNPGQTTITVADGQVAEMHQAQEVAASSSSNHVAMTFGPSE